MTTNLPRPADAVPPRCVNCDRPLAEDACCPIGCDQFRQRNDGAGEFEDFLASIQNAEEMGGPEGMDYVRLMEKIAAEATRRAGVVRAKLADLELERDELDMDDIINTRTTEDRS